uniref:Uncharacterized protein n=1 Tax=Rhizophora mucronata TaxID=61149 RepID=A0A2P2QHJ7_RHIMU
MNFLFNACSFNPLKGIQPTASQEKVSNIH